MVYVPARDPARRKRSQLFAISITLAGIPLAFQKDAPYLFLMGKKFSAALAVVVCAFTATAQAQDVELSILGDDEDLTTRLQAASLLLQESEEPRTPQDFVAAARADYGRLVAALYDAGHFSPVVRIDVDGREAARIAPFDRLSAINQITINVDPGPAFELGVAEIGPLASETILPEEFRPGGDASTRILRDTANTAIEAWRSAGNATASVESQQITARNNEAILDVRVRIAPGETVRFGTLVPRGQDRMRVDRILAIAGLPEGERFSPATLERVEARLQETGVFSAISLQEGEVSPDGVMNIDATLVETLPRRFGFGAEVSTDNGLALNAFWLHRNLFGGAERLRIDGEIGGIGASALDLGEDDGIDASVGLRYSRPATFSADTTAFAEFSAEILDEPAFSETTIGIGAGVEHRFNTQLTGSAGLSLDYFDIDDELGRRELTLLSAPLSLTWDRRENPLDARGRFYLAGTAQPFVTSGGSGGARLYLDGRAYFGFGEDDASRIAVRTQLGSVIGGNIEEIPPSLLFFSGGAGTVRGQQFQSLGAVQNGVESGGRSFAGLSTEFRQDIGDTAFGIVAFADAGLVAAGSFVAEDSAFQAGAGLGVRYDTPFGPLRVDVAAPVSGNDSDSSVFLYIGIGHSF